MYNNVPVVTINYYLSNGHVERRPKLIKAGKFGSDALANPNLLVGISSRHRDILKIVAEGQ